MPDLNWVLVENHHVAFTHRVHLQTRIPGQKRIGLRSRGFEMAGRGPGQVTQVKTAAGVTLQRFHARRERDQGTGGLG